MFFDAPEEGVQSERLQKIFQLMGTHQFDAAEVELKKGIEEAEKAQDKTMEALFYSTLGVLFKLKKDYKTSWRHYEKAEKLLPEDPSLKLISARLLVEVFGQFDLAIKKAQKVLKIAKNDWTLLHQAQSTLGLAYLKKGDKKKAITALTRAMEGDFEGMANAGSIDFKLLEALLRKNLAFEECRTYITKALTFANRTGEFKEAQIFTRLLNLFPSPQEENKFIPPEG
jgi:tetratricopeptide (TPR) repeat protein